MKTKTRSPILHGMKLCSQKNRLEIALHYLLELFVSHPLACPSGHTLTEGADSFGYLTTTEVKLTISCPIYDLSRYVRKSYKVRSVWPPKVMAKSCDMLTVWSYFPFIIFRMSSNFFFFTIWANQKLSYLAGGRESIIYISWNSYNDILTRVPDKYLIESDSDNNSKCKGFTLFYVKIFDILYIIIASSKIGKAREKQGEVKLKPQFTANLEEHFQPIIICSFCSLLVSNCLLDISM